MKKQDGWREAPDHAYFRDGAWRKDNRTYNRDADRMRRQRRDAFKKQR